MNNIGMAMSFIAGPVLVPGVSAEINPLPKGDQYQQIKADVLKYMYITFGSCALVFLLILAYFPTEPPEPPSVSAGIERANYKESIRMILKNVNFWILALVYSIPNGAGTGWVSVIDLILSDFGVSQTTAGWIGFTAAIVSSVGAIILACLADIFKGRIKQFLIILYSVAALTFILFIFIYYKVIISMPLLYISLITTAFGALANAPLFYSMASEVASASRGSSDKWSIYNFIQISFYHIFIGTINARSKYVLDELVFHCVNSRLSSCALIV